MVKRWYTVYLANPEMSELKVYRTLWDKIWRSDEPGFMLFHLENGAETRINKRWIIKLVSL